LVPSTDRVPGDCTGSGVCTAHALRHRAGRVRAASTCLAGRAGSPEPFSPPTSRRRQGFRGTDPPHAQASLEPRCAPASGEWTSHTRSRLEVSGYQVGHCSAGVMRGG
jgi:hypothetical protein